VCATRQAIAQHFALAGASAVTITGRTVSSLQETAAEIEKEVPGCSVSAFPADVTDAESVQRLFDQLPGVPDVLVNNAGIAAGQVTLAESNPDTWWNDVVSFAPSIVRHMHNVHTDHRTPHLGSQCQGRLPVQSSISSRPFRKARGGPKRFVQRIDYNEHGIEFVCVGQDGGQSIVRVHPAWWVLSSLSSYGFSYCSLIRPNLNRVRGTRCPLCRLSSGRYRSHRNGTDSAGVF
jgi:hypothetical protein